MRCDKVNKSDYKSDTCSVERSSDLDSANAEKMIGKTVSKVAAGEYYLTIIFSDGSSVTCEGYRWDECPMGVEYIEA